MKNAIAITVSILLLVSCSNKGQQVDTAHNSDSSISIEAEEGYEDVFPASKDSVCIIPEYVYSTNWMKRYIQYIEKNFEGADGLWIMKNGEESFDCKYWSLAYVNNDTIPEMLLYGGCWASGSIILTQYNGKVYMSPKGGFMFIEGADGLIHSQQSHSDEIWGEVYQMNKGHFVEKCNYYCFTNYYDTSEVKKYGLEKENITNWLMDNGTVGISGIILNGEVVDASYGRYNWYYDELRHTMDSLYYSKGTSIYFPKPKQNDETQISIGELLQQFDN